MNIKKYFLFDCCWWNIFKRGPRTFMRPLPWLLSLFYNSPLHWWLVLLMPNQGTRSVLFGVHQFLWHPFTVWRAWRYLYGRNPDWVESICILCHDLGYWGKRNMDGPEGISHPEGGATIARWFVYHIARLTRNPDPEAMARFAFELALYHSTFYAQQENQKVSALYLPDKVCVLFDPRWLYLLRGQLSGEVYEYLSRQNHARWMLGEPLLQSPREWFDWYRAKIRVKADDYFKTIAILGEVA